MSAAFDGLREYQYLYDQYTILVGKMPTAQRKDKVGINEIQRELALFHSTVTDAEKKSTAELLQRQSQRLIENLTTPPQVAAPPAPPNRPSTAAVAETFFSLADALGPCAGGGGIFEWDFPAGKASSNAAQ